jgi:dienelactone hydrolase
VRRLPLLLVCLLAAWAGAPAAADRLVPKAGKAQDGVVVKQTEEEVVFNPFFSKNPEMQWGVVTLPLSRVKKVEVRPRPEVEFFRRLEAVPPGDADALLALGRYAKDEKLKAHAEMAFALAAVAAPDRKEAVDAVGGKGRLEALKKGNLLLDAELRDLLATYVATTDAAERKAQTEALLAKGFEGGLPALERCRRSALEPRGYQEGRPLAWGADQHPGATYALYVPEAYTPTRLWPLLIGLHGGGPDGKLGDEVVGSGASAMNFYRDLAARHGYIVACPDALEASWGTPRNEAMVRALIRELLLTFHVDVDRVYMTGHSMGGFGTWALGPRLAEDLAAISPMAGGGGGGISELVKTKTPIFIYHSDDDYVSVEPDRAAAKQLQDTDLDFVYTELVGRGHSMPESIRLELFEFLGPRRRFDPRHKDAWPRSSFAEKPTKEEALYLGDPTDPIEGRVPDLADLAKQLRLGGGRAAAAGRIVAEQKPEGAAAALSKVLKDTGASLDARAWTARALGLLGDPEGAKALRRALGEEPSKDAARLVREAASALVKLGDAEAGGALDKAVKAWTAFFESKVAGSEYAFSDWERIVPTLADLVSAWGTVDAGGSAADLDATVVRRVLAAGVTIQTSERVPQDPSVARAALAQAVARAYARWTAGDDLWEHLLAAVSTDERARKAATGERP